MSFATTSRVSFLNGSGSSRYFSSLLPEIVSKDCETRPYSPSLASHWPALDPERMSVIHHPKINPYRCPWSTQALIENLLQRREQFKLAEKLIDSLELFVQFIERGVDKAVAKTELLSYGCTHSRICTTIAKNDREKNDFFQ
jgi:hypothetical protein